MSLLFRINQLLVELKEQKAIVKGQYGGKFIYVDMLWSLLRYGARPIDYSRFEFYRKSSRERNRYLTIFRYFKLISKFRQIKNKKLAFGRNKSDEYNLFKNYVSRDWLKLDKCSNEQIIKFLNRHNECVLKPNSGEQGKGVRRFQWNNNNLEEILQYVGKDYLIEEVVSNAGYVREINPSSLNTIRAYTIVDKNGVPKILAIMLRVGRQNNYVDNWGSGGIGLNFDLDTGICVDYARDKNNMPYCYHPDTNVQFIGFKLKDFESLKDYIIRLALEEKALRFVGWDIAITDSGYELIEVNCPGGHDFLQAFGTPFYHVIKNSL